MLGTGRQVLPMLLKSQMIRLLKEVTLITEYLDLFQPVLCSLNLRSLGVSLILC